MVHTKKDAKADAYVESVFASRYTAASVPKCVPGRRYLLLFKT